MSKNLRSFIALFITGFMVQVAISSYALAEPISIPEGATLNDTTDISAVIEKNPVDDLASDITLGDTNDLSEIITKDKAINEHGEKDGANRFESDTNEGMLSVQSVSPSGYVWPLRSAGTITQHFGSNGHTGTDIAIAAGSDVLATLGGTVKYVQGWDGHSTSDMQSYGNLVIIYHPENGTATYYAHLNDISVSLGQTVSQGQVIGHVGSTGNSTGAHLHLELRLGANHSFPQY